MIEALGGARIIGISDSERIINMILRFGDIVQIQKGIFTKSINMVSEASIFESIDSTEHYCVSEFCHVCVPKKLQVLKRLPDQQSTFGRVIGALYSSHKSEDSGIFGIPSCIYLSQKNAKDKYHVNHYIPHPVDAYGYFRFPLPVPQLLLEAVSLRLFEGVETTEGQVIEERPLFQEIVAVLDRTIIMPQHLIRRYKSLSEGDLILLNNKSFLITSKDMNVLEFSFLNTKKLKDSFCNIMPHAYFSNLAFNVLCLEEQSTHQISCDYLLQNHYKVNIVGKNKSQYSGMLRKQTRPPIYQLSNDPRKS